MACVEPVTCCDVRSGKWSICSGQVTILHSVLLLLLLVVSTRTRKVIRSSKTSIRRRTRSRMRKSGTRTQTLTLTLTLTTGIRTHGHSTITHDTALFLRCLAVTLPCSDSALL